MGKSTELRVCKDLDELNATAAVLFLELSLEKTGEKGFFTAVLSGGKTPEALYKLLATPQFKVKIPWEKVHLFWGDERCVGPDDPESNYGMAEKALISKVGIPAGNVHRIKGELSAPVAASLYEDEIKAFFGKGEPVFDLVMLGLGDDGHTLSLFPATTALVETKRLVAGNFVEKFGSWRVTMTLPLVNRASNLVFMAAGAGKSAVVKEVFEGSDHPADRIRPINGRLVWLLDTEAAKLL
ncbi:MAG: 6-phosphogluconolactonase [Deltaproteobacteria bacterium]|nr:6-phosphogluconolactonase [Deltaproteobacteria bacterium]